MSVSSVSSVNQYLLSTKSSVPTLTLRQANMLFPGSFTGLATTLGNMNVANARITFSSGMSGTAWRDVTNGYEIECSSYFGYTGPPTIIYNGNEIFDGLSDANSFWSPSSNSSQLNYFLMGVDKGKYTQASSYNASGIYIGGGTNYFWTTVYDTNQSVNGEWIQVEFPFKAMLLDLQMCARFNAPQRGPKNVRVLGSDNGTTWTFIADVLFGTYTNSSYQIKAITTTLAFSYIRCVFIDIITADPNLNIGDMRLRFDAYT